MTVSRLVYPRRFSFVDRTQFAPDTASDDDLDILDGLDGSRVENYSDAAYSPSGDHRNVLTSESKKVNVRKGAAKRKVVEKTREMTRFESVNKTQLAPFHENVDDARPKKNAWSQYILYGTPASNQRMFLIHEELRKMVQSLESQALARVKNLRKEEGYQSDGTDEDPESEDELSSFPD